MAHELHRLEALDLDGVGRVNKRAEAKAARAGGERRVLASMHIHTQHTCCFVGCRIKHCRADGAVWKTKEVKKKCGAKRDNRSRQFWKPCDPCEQLSLKREKTSEAGEKSEHVEVSRSKEVGDGEAVGTLWRPRSSRR